MPYYAGYLSGHVDHIKALAAQGNDRLTIAGLLFADGVRSPHRRSYWNDNDHIAAMSAMVAYVIRGGNKKKPKPAKAKTTTMAMDWQTWTPEMQEAEFQMGYSR